MAASGASRSKAMGELLDFHGNGQAAATPGEGLLSQPPLAAART